MKVFGLISSFIHSSYKLQRSHTFDEIKALIQSIDDIVATIEGYDAQSDIRQQMGITVNLIQCVMQSFQWLDPVIALNKLCIVKIRLNTEFRNV